MKCKAIIHLLSLVLMVSYPLSAQPCHEGPEPCGGHKEFCEGHKEFIKELNLTDEQHTKLKLLKLDMKKEQIIHFDEVRKTRKKIKEELLKEKPSQGTLNGYAKELGKLHSQLSEKRMTHLLKVKEVLTKGQFEKILSKELRNKMFHHKKHGKHKKGF